MFLRFFVLSCYTDRYVIRGGFLMIRRLFILLALFVVVGLGPALAQDLFVRKNKDEKTEGEKPSLFVKPKTQSAGVYEVPSSSVRADKLKVRQQQAMSNIRVESLAELVEMGLRPRNAAEIEAYGQAHRARSQATMYKRREALIAHHERQEKKFHEEILQYQRQENERRAAIEKSQGSGKNAVVLNKAEPENKPSTSGSASGETHKADKSKARTKLFVRPSDKDKAKPGRVFNPY